MTQRTNTHRNLFLMLIFGWVFSAVCAQSATLNEWNFYSDPAGKTLSQAVNSKGAASFLPGNEAGLATDGLGNLLCAQNDAGSTSGMWTTGEILDATLPAAIHSGVQYLRYDFSYDLNDINNDSGCVAGFAFYDGAGDKLAGVILQYDIGADVVPSYTVTDMTEMTNTIGTVAVIAKIDLSAQTFSVWYDLSGDVSGFSGDAPSTSVAVSMTSFDSLRFQATGDITPAGSSDHVAVDLLRTADSWEDILVADPAAPPALQIQVTDSLSGSMDAGETNAVSVVIRNAGGVATNVTSVLSHDGAPGAFTVTSNHIAQTLLPADSVTNTYAVIANTNGSYLFTVQALVAGTGSSSTHFTTVVGSQISYLGNSIAEVSGGVIPGKYEPGEILDITVVSTNNGAKTVSNVVNSISADPAYFSISNLTSSTYSLMPVGAVTSTVYRVTVLPAATDGTYGFSVTNQAGSKVWTNAFVVDVFVDALPAVTPAFVNLTAVEGHSDTATLIVTNGGNVPVSFTITDDAVWDVVYVSETESSRVAGAATPITLNGSSPETRGISAAIDLGFDFSLYGTAYSKFYVTSDGVVGLSNTTNTPALGDSYGSLPGDDNPLIAPFWGMLSSPEGSIRYTANEERVVISYLGVEQLNYEGDNLEFQAILYASGQIEFRYENMTSEQPDRVTIGIQGDADHYENLSITPASGTSVSITPIPIRWVSYAPASNVSVGPQQSVEVTFTADATDRSAGESNSFAATFNWSSGTSDAVAVSAVVTAAMPAYSASASLSFTGAAEQVTSAPFVITNTGTGLLDFTISDDSALTATMVAATNVVYDWVDISGIGHPVDLIKPGVNPFVTATDEGYSEMIPVGFVFPFFGRSYSDFSVGVNGALRLDTTGRIFDVRDIASTNLPAILPDQLIAPYGGDLFVDGNATLKTHSTAERLVVTWENMGQYGFEAGSNLTFQVILKPSGSITFQYKVLDGHQWPKTVVGGLRNAAGTNVISMAGDIRQVGDWTMNTNYPTSSTSYTQYVDSVVERMIAVQPDEVQVITYTPGSDSIPVGGTAEITLTGNAAGLALGGNTISASTQLTIEHNGTPSTNTLDVTFTVTNSQQTVFAAALMDDSDGDGVADDDERTAGTDPQDAASVFTPDIERNDNGLLLSWEDPLDGLQRTYKIYWTADLMSGWNYLATVTNGTAYQVDAAHSEEPVVYYKVTAE